MPPDERRVLAALAVVGHATLSGEELAGATAIGDAGPVVDELRRRGLVRTDERERHSLLGTVGDEIRRTEEALATAERLRGYFETLARGGRLDRRRVQEDAEAILGLSGFLAEAEQWQSVLELVETVDASFSIAETVTEWIALLREGREAARMLGNVPAELAMLDRLAEATYRAGDGAASQRYARQAKELRRGAVVPPPPPPPPPSGGGVWRTVGIVVGLLAAAGIGLGAGVLLSGGSDNAGSTTTPLPVTITEPGGTFVTVETATLPAVTVEQTVTETETVSTTETVVTTVAPPTTTIG